MHGQDCGLPLPSFLLPTRPLFGSGDDKLMTCPIQFTFPFRPSRAPPSEQTVIAVVVRLVWHLVCPIIIAAAPLSIKHSLRASVRPHQILNCRKGQRTLAFEQQRGKNRRK